MPYFIPPELMRITAVRPLEKHRVWGRFHNGEERELDLEPYLAPGNGVFAPVYHDPSFFRQVLVEGISIAWPNGDDRAPVVRYYGLKP
jgi:hypothetical protein